MNRCVLEKVVDDHKQLWVLVECKVMCAPASGATALIGDPHEVCSLILYHVDTFNVIKWWSRSGITTRVITNVTGRKIVIRILFDTKQGARHVYWVYGDQL